MTISGWVWRTLLAGVGCIAAAYVGDELLGGEALGWILGGAILAGFCAPLFKALLARNAERARRR